MEDFGDFMIEVPERDYMLSLTEADKEEDLNERSVLRNSVIIGIGEKLSELTFACGTVEIVEMFRDEIRYVQKHQLELLKKLQIFENASGSVRVRLDNEVIVLIGEKSDVLKKKNEILEMIGSFVCNIFPMDEGVARMLSERKFADHLEKVLKKKSMNITWDVDYDWNEAAIYGQTWSDVFFGFMAIEAELVCCKIELNDEEYKALKNPLWLDVKEELMYHPLLMVEERGHVIKIYGIRDMAEKFRRDVQNFLKDYKVVTISVPVPADCNILVLGETGVGKSTWINAVANYITNHDLETLIETLIVVEVTLQQDGMHPHFQSVAGRNKLENIQLKYGVGIENVWKSLKATQDKFKKNENILQDAQNMWSDSEGFSHEKKLNNGVTLKVIRSDITKCRGDVIVCPLIGDVKQVEKSSKIICGAAGPTIQEECDAFISKHGDLYEGDIYVSQPGRLDYKNIMHVVSPDWSNHDSEVTLRHTITGILNKANRSGYTSIALPIIGAGISGLALEKVCYAIQEGIANWAEATKNCHLKEISIVDENRNAIRTFSACLEKNEAFPAKGMWSRTDCIPSPDYEQIIYSHQTPVKLRLVGFSEQQISRAVEDLEQYCSQVMQTCVIDDEHCVKIIANLTDKQIDQIKSLEKGLCVHIEVDREHGRIQIKGEEHIIIDVKYNILNLLKQ